MKDLRIADLELFITAAHLKNLGKAAACHHLSQSAASTAVARVEQAFGELLCTHERRNFRLTPEGQRLLPRAEAWLKSLRETVAVKELQPVRVVTTHAMARVVVPTLLPIEKIELVLERPDRAYSSVLNGQADLALVLDNAPWKGVYLTEIGKGKFQLFSSLKKVLIKPILLPEDQIEVLTFRQRWLETYKTPLAVKACIPSWSLIADICSTTSEVGFLPDFLAQKMSLHAVPWQPEGLPYRILALHTKTSDLHQKRISTLLAKLQEEFKNHFI